MTENYQPAKTLEFEIRPDGRVFKTIELLPLWDEPKRIDPARMKTPSGLMPVPSDTKAIAEQVRSGNVKLRPVIAFYDGRGDFWLASDYDRQGIIQHIGIPYSTEAVCWHGTEGDARRYAILSGHAVALEA